MLLSVLMPTYEAMSATASPFVVSFFSFFGTGIEQAARAS